MVEFYFLVDVSGEIHFNKNVVTDWGRERDCMSEVMSEVILIIPFLRIITYYSNRVCSMTVFG